MRCIIIRKVVSDMSVADIEWLYDMGLITLGEMDQMLCEVNVDE